MIPIKNGLVKY